MPGRAGIVRPCSKPPTIQLAQQEIIMETRKTSRIALTTLAIVAVCFSASASAHNDKHVIRDILLAPLLLPAAIIAASTPQPVVYHETYYVHQPRRVVYQAPPPRRVVHHVHAPAPRHAPQRVVYKAPPKHHHGHHGRR
jgi:hypothetical protein